MIGVYVRFATVLGAIFAAPVAMSANLEFKGIAMGATVDEYKAAVAGLDYLSCQNVDSAGNGFCYGTTGLTYADQYVTTVSADFLQGRLAQVSIETLGGSGGLISQALAAKYGNYQTKKVVPQTLKNGIKYNSTVTTWRLKDGGVISIEDHATPNAGVYTALTSPNWIAWQKKRGKLSEKAKSDL